MLASSLKAVISQTLVKKIGGGRIAALEVLHVTMPVAANIREAKTYQIASADPVTSTERQVLDARDIQVVDGQISGLSIVNDRLDAVLLTDGASIPRAALFIKPALRSRDGSLIRPLGVEVDEGGFARVDPTGRTTCKR